MHFRFANFAPKKNHNRLLYFQIQNRITILAKLAKFANDS